MTRSLLLCASLLLSGCATDVGEADPDGRRSPDPEAEGPGCDAELEWDDLCLGQDLLLWDRGDDPCPEFWEAVDADGPDWLPMGSSGGPSVQDLALPVAVDGLELRFLRSEDGVYSGPTVVDAAGTLCGDASDPAACAAAVDAPPDPVDGIRKDCWFDCTHYFLVWSRGDEVGFVDDLSALVDFLGPVDTPTEAALAVFSWTDMDWHGEGSERFEGRVRRADVGYEAVVYDLIIRNYVIRHDRVLLHIPPEGRPTTLERAIHEVLCDEEMG